jgi:mannose-6-phosphate isomerase-like protein (cupin superfamily)
VSRYTKVNLADVEDQAPKFGFSPDLEARFASGDLDLQSAGVSYQRLRPGVRLPWGHSHKIQEELYVVLAGSGRLKLDDEIVEVRALDAVRIAPETVRGLEAGPEGIDLLAFGAPKAPGSSVADDVEQQPGWWT